MEDRVMNDRVDQKLKDVELARYQYRHEAEFAAGFLDDVGIPYRLQVDEAMGLTAQRPAILWVRALDERRARAAIEHATHDPSEPIPWEEES
jgi:hypothetical protein